MIAAVWVRQLVKGMSQVGDRILEQRQLDAFGQAQASAAAVEYEAVDWTPTTRPEFHLRFWNELQDAYG